MQDAHDFLEVLVSAVHNAAYAAYGTNVSMIRLAHITAGTRINTRRTTSWKHGYLRHSRLDARDDLILGFGEEGAGAGSHVAGLALAGGTVYDVGRPHVVFRLRGQSRTMVEEFEGAGNQCISVRGASVKTSP